VLEEEGGLRRRAPAERKAGDDELIQRGIQLGRLPLGDGRQQLVGALPAEWYFSISGSNSSLRYARNRSKVPTSSASISRL
jgi:hypothetical protein